MIMQATVALILIIIGLLALAILISALRSRSAVAAVIKIFRKHQATDPERAKTRTELGLNVPTFTERLVTPLRDFKPGALQSLIQAEVVAVTEDDRLYLVEEKAAKIPYVKAK